MERERIGGEKFLWQTTRILASPKNNEKKPRGAISNPIIFFVPNVYGQIVHIRIRNRGRGYNPILFHEFPNRNGEVPFFVVKRWTLQTAINLVEDFINYKTYRRCNYAVKEIDREDVTHDIFSNIEGAYESYKEIKTAVNGRGHIEKYRFPEDEVEKNITSLGFYDLNGNYVTWVEKGSNPLSFQIDNTYTVIDKVALKKFAYWLKRYHEGNDTTLHQEAAIFYIDAAAFNDVSFVLE